MMTRERIQELRGLVGSEFDDELTIDGATAWELLALAEEALVIRESDIADQPAPNETGPVDIGGGMKLHQATDPRHRLPPEVLALLTQSEPAPTETGPRCPHIHMAPQDDGSKACTWCGARAETAPQGAPVVFDYIPRDPRTGKPLEAQSDRCPDCLRLDGTPHATTCKQHERW